MESYEQQQHYLRSADTAATAVASLALQTIDKTYSYSGNPKYDAAAQLYMPYHNGLHTRGVCLDVRMLRDVVGLTPFEYDIALMAAASHDVIQELDGTDGMNEDASANWLAEHMQAYPTSFTDTQVQYGRLAILGTKYHSEGIHIVRQQAVVQDYPSKSAERIAHVVAGADLGKLYAVDGPFLGHKLHQERTTGASGRPPAIDDRLLAFQEAQVQIVIGGYAYPSLEIRQALQLEKCEQAREVITYSKAILKDLQAGNIESWDALLQRDLEFTQKNS